jgi:hypothetical protein
VTRKVVVWVVVASVVLIYFVVDPSSGILPECPFYKMTGLYCPGCGSQRSLHMLLHGRPGLALGLNPLLVVGLIYTLIETVILVAQWMGAKVRTMSSRKHVPWIVLAVIVVFWIARNIPMRPFSMLAP